MDADKARERLVSRIDELMRHGGAPLVVRRNQWPTALRVAALETPGLPASGGSGEVPADAGSDGVCGALEVDTRRLTEAEIAVVHPILRAAGALDAMEYTHLDVEDPEDLPEEACLGVVFEQAVVGADLVLSILEALGVAYDEIDASV